MLFLEIMLTIAAWRRGYKGFALIPVGLALLVGFLIGLNNPEMATSDDILSFIWIDILAVVVLGIMIVLGKNPDEEETLEIEASSESVSAEDAYGEIANS